MTNKTWDVLMVAGALGGCGAADQMPAAPTVAPPATAATAEPRPAAESLARLRALEVFTVGEMTVQRPEEAYNCYGPCPGAEAVIARAERAAVVRLDAFTRAAEAAAAATTPPAGACEPAAIDANLAALRALHVLEVGDLLRAEPVYSGHCYGVCPADAEAARRQTCARAERLAAIAAAAP